MKILVISNVPWDTRNSYGNTLSNWFEGWSDTSFYNIYCRSALPLNSVCKGYYTVPPLDLIKHLFCPSKIGVAFEDDAMPNNLYENENALIQSAQQGNLEWMYLLSDFVYSTGIWKTRRYRKFIKDADPDVVFSFGIADSFMYENYCYIKRHTHAKIVTFVADDVYGAYLNSRKLRSRLQSKRFRQMIAMSDIVYGASEELCAAYQNIFKKQFTTLYKGCSIITQKKQCVNTPIRIIYAGNLLWGRDDVLAKVAALLEKINENGLKASLEIYTGAFVTPEISAKLNKGNSSRICGRRTYEEIVKIQESSDIILHVESFEKEQIEIVKYSFSTKIIDCLQSGGTMLVIGPRGISSVEYSRHIPGVVVIDDLKDLKNALGKIVQDTNGLIERSKQIRDYALIRHSISEIRNKLKNDFIKILQCE